MKIIVQLIFLILLAMILGCSGTQVRQDYDPSRDFSILKTYDWKPGRAEKTDNSFLDGRIRATADQSLAEKGYQKVAYGKADFLIGYQYKIDSASRPDNLTTSVGVDGGSFGNSGGVGVGLGARGSGGVSSQGTLTIEISDAATYEPLWRGSSTLLVPEYRGPEVSASAVSREVDKILAQFPPET